ncbi:hypothetical protein PG993_009831 [Apiospora rasikravindrae]|uniref:Uncharacterized protein n=1 Tax=Apiospora rasikravindrae TaxID=990691 RepID=A0ABR1SLV5_9PEZI
MEAILNYRPTRLERAEGFFAAICLAFAVMDPGPDPEFDAFFNQLLRAKGLPPLPVEPTGEGELFKVLKYGPFGKARTILAVMAPVSLCFVFLSPETKRAIVNRVNRKNLRYVLTDLLPKAAKGYLSILLPQLAVAAFNHLLLPYLVRPDPYTIDLSLDQILLSQMKTIAFLFLRYWRPGNRALVRGLSSGLLGLRAFSGFSRQQNPRFWMFFDIAACAPCSNLVLCGLFGPLWDFPRYACECAQAFVTAAAATRLERALHG